MGNLGDEIIRLWIVSLQKLRNLTYLDLSYNKITHFLMINVPKKVKHLNLHRNQITAINMRWMVSLMFKTNKFEVLDLRLNPLDCKCDRFVNDLKSFNYGSRSCDYFDCYVCNWLKQYVFHYKDSLGDSLSTIQWHRQYCIIDTM